MKGKTYPLDLSALAYPMMRTRRTESNFRFTAQLEKPVDPLLLTESLSAVLARYPLFKTKIVPSFFWHVFREYDAPLLVKEDARPPLRPLRKEDTNGYPFRLAYRKNEIVLEVFHAVTDAKVAALFLCDLLTVYADIEAGTMATELSARNLLPEDAFLRNGKKKRLRDISLKSYDGGSVYALGKKGHFRDYPELLSFEIPIEQLKSAAKERGVTVTEYVAAAYVCAITEGEPLPLKKGLCIFIPIDLRRFFPSDTIRNFVCFERIFLPKGESDLSFPHVLSVVHEEFIAKITRENMQTHVDDVRRLFTLPVVSRTPLFIKQPLFKFVKRLTNKVRQTAILSNIGNIDLSKSAKKVVKNVKFFLNIGKNAPINVAVCTCNGICNIDVTNGISDRVIPERFFALLQSQGKK